MKVRKGKSGKPAKVPVGTHRVVDIGFGDGRRLKGMQNEEGLVIEGVERPKASRIKLPGKLLRYIGFDEWIKIAKNNAYETIYADLFFHHYFHEKILSKASKPVSTAVFIEKEIAVMSEIFGKMHKKLVPGGKLEFSFAVPDARNPETRFEKQHTGHSIKSVLERAGFVNVNIHEMKKSEAISTHSSGVLEHPYGALLVFTAAKPNPKRKPIELDEPRRIFVVHPDGRAEERTVGK